MAILTHPDACEPWGYVAPGVAAVMTRAYGVRHIYLIAEKFLLILNSQFHSSVVFIPPSVSLVLLGGPAGYERFFRKYSRSSQPCFGSKKLGRLAGS